MRCVFRSQSDSLTLDVPPSHTSAWRAVVRVLRSPVDSLSCALLPASCCVCSQSLLRFTRVPVCDSCWDSLAAQPGFLCSCCGADLGVATFGDAEPPQSFESTCDFCRRARPNFRRAVAYGAYQGTLRALIHRLKYDGMQPIAHALGVRLAEAILSLAPEAPSSMIVVPVPLHTGKRHQRGFNHAERLASAAVQAVRIQRPGWNLSLATGVLERQRSTASQAGLSPRQRRENVRGAFFVPRPLAIQKADVLLVDDIYTTGATARACTRALLAAGANSVWVATLARAQREYPVAPPPPERELPIHEDVAFWDSGFFHPAAPAPEVH